MLKEFRDFLMRGNLVEDEAASDDERRHQELLAALDGLRR